MHLPFSISVASWAQQFGEELWELGEKMTKSKEIRLVKEKQSLSLEHRKITSSFTIHIVTRRNTKAITHASSSKATRR